METVSRADQSAPPPVILQRGGCKQRRALPKTKQDARTILRGLAPLELAKQKAVLSDVTRATLGSLHSAQRPALRENMNRFYSRCKSNAEHMLMYEDLNLRMYALSVIPMVELSNRARARHAEQGTEALAFGDWFYRELGRWFKSSFFKWTNAAPCEACGKSTTLVGRAQPTQEERRWHAGIVEVYKCNTCHSQTRFPRYNHPRKLLETRQGGCGEWANAHLAVAGPAVSTRGRLTTGPTMYGPRHFRLILVAGFTLIRARTHAIRPSCTRLDGGKAHLHNRYKPRTM